MIDPILERLYDSLGLTKETKTQEQATQHKPVLVETDGNLFANTAIAALFATDFNMSTIIEKATLFIVLFPGNRLRILWDERKNHAGIVKSITASCPDIRKCCTTEAVRLIKQTTPDKIPEENIHLSDTALQCFYSLLKCNKPASKPTGYRRRAQGSELFSWSPILGERIMCRKDTDSPWFVNYFCGKSKNKIFIANGLLVKEISPFSPFEVAPAARPIFRSENRRLVQVVYAQPSSNERNANNVD